MQNLIRHVFGLNGDQDGEDMWTQGLFISMYDKILYKLKEKKMYIVNTLKFLIYNNYHGR